MDENSIVQIVSRIEEALSRVESAAGVLGDLAGRHDKLQRSVEEALGEIDALIAERGEAGSEGEA